MENINDIIINEFQKWGYTQVNEVDGRPFFINANYTTCVDYWLVSYDIDDFNNQKGIFDKVMEISTNMKFVEKNLSLLLLVDMDNPNNKKNDTIEIENEKSYFKKYVLKYNQESVKGLIDIINEKKAKSIAELTLDIQYFSKLQSDIGQLTPNTLLYSIAHKLPFIMINPIPIVRTGVELNLTEELVGMMQWVTNAPNDTVEIVKYINDTINNEVNE